MKKYLLGFMASLVAVPLVLSGCTPAALDNAPTTTAQMQTLGSALVYDDYVYFANAFQSSSEMEDGYDAKNTGIWRIALEENGSIPVDEETSLARSQQEVLAKVAASEYTFMYSSSQYIYFAAPSEEIDPSTHGEHFYTRNQYFQVGTDGTGLKQFYASSNSITQQSILKIDGKEYLLIADGTKLVRITLGTNFETKILAEDFTSVAFASSYQTDGDQYAYFLKALPDDPAYMGAKGSLLYAVNIQTGEPALKDSEGEAIALNQNQTRTLTLKTVKNGHLLFTIKELVGGTEMDETYASLTGAFTYTTISSGLSSITAFDAIMAENQTVYYVISDTNSGTYALPAGTQKLADHKLLDQEISLLFTAGDYVYFTYKDTDANAKGMHRISVQDKIVQQINTVEKFKTSNISFDGTHIYFYALNTDNTTGTYYLHRSRVDIGQTNIELLSTLLEKDQPAEETEE